MTGDREPADGDLYVSPAGDDGWSGASPAPNDAGTDGPFRTIERARTAVRERREGGRLGNDTVVWLRGGTYRRSEPLVFGPEDPAPVTCAGSPGETPVIDGSRPLEGRTETTVNGVDAWVTPLDALAADSPAREVGFEPIDLDVGPRPPGER